MTAGRFTQRVYADLPDVLRATDARQTLPTTPLLTYLDAVGEQLEDAETFIDRNAYVPDDERTDPRKLLGSGTLGSGLLGDPSPHDLVDPYGCDLAWLPWLAQLTGVTDDPTQPIPVRRASVANASASWAHGTREAIARLVRPALTGNQYVRVAPGYGSPYVIAVYTLVAETPAGLDTGALAQTEQPSGYRLLGVTLDPTR